MANSFRNKAQSPGLPATKPMPGDYQVGSVESRAVARLLAEQKGQPTHPPIATVDFRGKISVERARELRNRLLESARPIREGEPYLLAIFPDLPDEDLQTAGGQK